MPLGPADNKGTVLYYGGTGVLEGATTYTALMFVHGAIFHRGMSPAICSSAIAYFP